MPHLEFANVGVRIMVLQSDLDEATKILKECENNTSQK